MATGGEEQVGYSLANVRTLTLEKNTDESPYYISIVICQDKIIAVDNKDKVKIHRLQNGKFLEMLDSRSPPRNICLMDATTICVLHYDGLIEMASIKSEDMVPVFTRRRSLCLHGVLLDKYHCVVSFNDNIVVVGEKQGTIYWCIVSLDDGHVNTIHFICKESIWSDVKTKDTMIYVSCCAGVKSPNTGVYGFDSSTPSQCKYKYKHQRLQKPTSIVISEEGNIFVGNFGVHVGNGVIQDSCIHQLTASCQLVAIFTQGIPWYITAMFWYHGRMYVTCDRSRDITVFRYVYQGSHKASYALVSDERKQPGIKEAAIQIAQRNVDNGQLSVETERPPSGSSHENNEDEKQGNHKDSEVPISDEERQPIIEGTSTQIGQDIVDNGQLSVETERPPSGSSLENNEDEKHGNHNDSEVLISDEERQPVIEGTSTQMGQDIVDNGQLSVETERPSSGSSPENNEDEKHGNHKVSEVPISDEKRQLVKDGTSTQIVQGIVDNGQLSVETERPPSGSSPENNEDEKHGGHKVSEVPISDEERQPVIVGTSTQIGQDIVDNGQLSVVTERPPSGSSPENNEDEKHGSHKVSEVPISDEERQPVIEGTSTQIVQDIVDNGQLSVVTERPPSGSSPENNEDEKHGSHKVSEVPISDEERQPVIEGTSTQIVQDIVDNGQLSVVTERPPSGSSPENNEDEKHGSHKVSEVPISDEERQPVIEGTSTQIVQDIVDNGQLSVVTERPPSGSSPENNEDEKHGSHKVSEVPISDEERQPVIEGTSTQIVQDIVDNGQLSVVTERPPSGSSPENNEDEKHGSHKVSEVPISDEERQPVIEGTSTQIVQDIVDNGQLSVVTERPPSGSSPENNEDEKHGSHKVSEVPISDEERQPVIEGTSTQIVQDIVDNGQLSVVTERPPSGSSPENNEDEKHGATLSYQTGISANLLRPMRDQALVCPNRDVRHIPEGVAMIRQTERAYLPTGELHEPNTPFMLDQTYRKRLETGTMTDAAPSRQTVDTAVQCDIIQFRL